MNKIYIPTSSAEQWAQFLAEPVNHWRKGYSARTLAYSWQEANGFPIEVGSVLSSTFPAVELLLALPEHQVPLPGGSRPSQNDIWVLARSQGQLVSIAVEGKVSEPFGPTMQEWQAESSPGKAERLAYLLSLLGLSSAPDATRYQLLHRTASAIIEAQRFTRLMPSCWFTRSARPVSGSKTTRHLWRSWAAAQQKTTWFRLVLGLVFHFILHGCAAMPATSASRAPC